MKKTKKGFMSWYYNFIDAQKENLLEISIGKTQEEGNSEYYLSIASNQKAFSKEIKLSGERVKWEKDGMHYDSCSFDQNGIALDLEDEAYHIKGSLSFTENRGTNRSKWQTGVMGPFKYWPFLNSYHDVTSLAHQLSGSITINNETIDFTGGKGYMEKEWGKQYPKIWVWAQCNHFKEHDIALMVGVARMPFLWEYYTSFSVPVYYKGSLEVFSNYNGGQIAKLYRYKGYIHLIITQKSKVLDLKIYGEDEAELVSSYNSHMIRDVYQCQMAKMEIKIMQSNHIILEDVGYCCNIEIGGNTSKLK